MYVGIVKYRPISPVFFRISPLFSLGQKSPSVFRPEHLLWLPGLLGCDAIEKLLTGCSKGFPEFSQFRTGFRPFFVRGLRLLRLRLISFLFGSGGRLCVCDRISVVFFQSADEKSCCVSQVLRSCDSDLFQHVPLATLVEMKSDRLALIATQFQLFSELLDNL